MFHLILTDVTRHKASLQSFKFVNIMLCSIDDWNLGFLCIVAFEIFCGLFWQQRYKYNTSV
jgi:hypothetical protein